MISDAIEPGLSVSRHALIVSRSEHVGTSTGTGKVKRATVITVTLRSSVPPSVPSVAL